MYHEPVLLNESLSYLALTPGALAIDATLGDGGHSEGMLEQIGRTGRLLALDASPKSLARARARLTDRWPNLTTVHANFGELATVAPAHGFAAVDGILFDLGVASWQLGLDTDERLLDPPSSAQGGLRPGQGILGLSFTRDEFLDMRLDPSRPQTAATLLNRLPPARLEELFERYGDLPRARPLVARIVAARRARPIERTSELAALLGTRSPKALAPVFQALRIAVNDELTVLDRALLAALALLRAGGRLVVISYHSGEDRVVKQRFRVAAADGVVTVLTDRPFTAPPPEIRRHPRSRSAKLRAIVKR